MVNGLVDGGWSSSGKARSKPMQRVVERWGKPGKAHLIPMLRVRSVGKGWSKGGESQAKPTLFPCFEYEVWGKGGPKGRGSSQVRNIV